MLHAPTTTFLKHCQGATADLLARGARAALTDERINRTVAALVASASAITLMGIGTLVARSDTGSPAPAVAGSGGGRSGAEVAVGAARVEQSPASTATMPTRRAEPLAAVSADTGATNGSAAGLAGRRGALPVGKGMWLWQPDRVEGGDVDALVRRAKEVGLTHLYVRTGSSRMGFYAADYLNRLLPRAHAAGLRVYGWDFPYFYDVDADVVRSVAAVRYTTPDGHRLDGFVPDIETIHEGTQLTTEAVAAFGQRLRAAVGSDYPLMVAVPRPSAQRIADYPYWAVVGPFDAIAPMVYWLNRQPDTDVAGTMAFLAQFGKPVIPVGQAYDGAPEGGRPGVPPRDEIHRFMRAAEDHGAVGASFWSWQHADQQAWDAIRDAVEFTLPEGGALRPGQVRAYQVLLSSLGYPAPASGAWDGLTVQALRTFQSDAGLPATGALDGPTRAALLDPRPPPLP